MSLYSDPRYYRDQRLDLSAPQDVPQDIADLDRAFRCLFQAQSYDQLDILREAKESAAESTNPDTKLSAELFAHFIH